MLETEYKFVYESQKYEYLSNFRGEHQTIDIYESSTNEDMFRHFKYCPDLRRLEYKSRHSFQSFIDNLAEAHSKHFSLINLQIPYLDL